MPRRIIARGARGAQLRPRVAGPSGIPRLDARPAGGDARGMEGEDGERREASTPAGFPALLEVVAGEEFPCDALAPQGPERAVRLLFHRRYPPRKGVWLLQVTGVEEWRREARGIHAADTLKALRWDAATRTLSVECVMDVFRARVARLDLRLARLDRDEPAKVTAADLPEWLKQELRQKEEERLAEHARAAGARAETARRAAAWGAGLGSALAFLNAAPWWTYLVAAPLLVAITSATAVRARLVPQAGAFWIGLPGFALAVATTGHVTMLPAFSVGLLHMALGVVLLLWLRDEESLRL
jgi:hypothetical protein